MLNGKCIVKGVRTSGGFPYQCTHPYREGVYGLQGLLKLFLDASIRQEERILLGKLNQDQSSHKRTQTLKLPQD